MPSTVPLCDPWLMMLAQYAWSEWLQQGRGAIVIDHDQWTKPELAKLDVLYVPAHDLASLTLPVMMESELVKSINQYNPLRTYVLCLHGELLQSIACIDMRLPIICINQMIEQARALSE